MRQLVERTDLAAGERRPHEQRPTVVDVLFRSSKEMGSFPKLQFGQTLGVTRWQAGLAKRQGHTCGYQP